MISTFSTKLILAGTALALVVGMSGAARAGDAAKETATAAAHAGMAAGAAAIDPIHMHLHHVVNCLVGPKGEGFDAAQANPCGKDGDGAIPDTADAAAKKKLMMGLAKAQDGIKATDLDAAKKDAADAAAALK